VVHEDQSPIAGLNARLVGRDRSTGSPVDVVIDDWWDRIHSSWRHSTHHLAIAYTARRAFDHLPDDDHVLLAKLSNGMECLIHVTEIDDFT